jgi:hypothetical protein
MVGMVATYLEKGRNQWTTLKLHCLFHIRTVGDLIIPALLNLDYDAVSASSDDYSAQSWKLAGANPTS